MYSEYYCITMCLVHSPYPLNENRCFTTLWCRLIRASVSQWQVSLRDYQTRLVDAETLHFWGHLVAAEKEPTLAGL